MAYMDLRDLRIDILLYHKAKLTLLLAPIRGGHKTKASVFSLCYLDVLVKLPDVLVKLSNVLVKPPDVLVLEERILTRD
jgi:hypothetical protein